MSKINAIRLINLNYNNNAIRVSDETFLLNAKSTLLSLRNGGGKSVLVQMVMAPFVHRRYQNAKDRPFASYFTGSKPTFILVEWRLDGGAGYVLTGMMVRRSQELLEDRTDELEMVNFIAEYKRQCLQDLAHFPVVERTKKSVVLKGFAECKQLFEGWKKDRGVPFFYYDMLNPAQSRQYFDKLAEYQIHYKEWESIIKKVNVKESGLSDLFADCKDEKGLVEKWFLEAVENKLNKEKNRIKEFQGIMEKYTAQYRDNQSKIKRRDTIVEFTEEAGQVRKDAERYQRAEDEVGAQQNRIADFIQRLRACFETERQRSEEIARQIEAFAEQIVRLEYERISGEIHAVLEQESFCSRNLQMLRMERDDLVQTRDAIARTIHALLSAKRQEDANECRKERDQEQERLALCLEQEENLEPERKRLGAGLLSYYNARAKETEVRREACDSRISQMQSEQEAEHLELEELRGAGGRLFEQAGALGAKIKAFDDAEDRFNRAYQEGWHRNILGEYESGELAIRRTEYEKELYGLEQERTKAQKEAGQHREQARQLQRGLEDQAAEKIRLEAKQEAEQSRLSAYEKELDRRRVMLKYFDLAPELLFETEQILAAAERRLSDTDLSRQSQERKLAELKQEYRRMAKGEVLKLPEEFLAMLKEAGIHYVFGMEWLKKNGYPEEKNRELAVKNPFLPYALILSASELKRLAAFPKPVYMPAPVPIVLRERLPKASAEQPALGTEEHASAESGAVRPLSDLHFYVWFNDNLLDEEKLGKLLSELESQIQKQQRLLEQKKQEYTQYVGMQEQLKQQKVTASSYEAAKEEIKRRSKELTELAEGLAAKREELLGQEELLKQCEGRARSLDQEIIKQERRERDFEQLCTEYDKYRENRRLLAKNKKERERVSEQQRLKKERIAKRTERLVTAQNSLAELGRRMEELAGKQAYFGQYAKQAEAEGPQSICREEEAQTAEIRYEAITSGISAEQKELERRLEAAEKRYAKALWELKDYSERHGLSEEAWKEISYDRNEEGHQETLLKEQERKISQKEASIHNEEIRYALLTQEKENKYAALKERCKKDEPIPAADIQTIDFTDAMKTVEYQKREAEKEEKRILKRLQSYEGNLAALAEYEEFECRETVEWEFEFSAMAGEALARQKGILVRDYHAYLEQRRSARLDLERTLNRMARREQFAEEFYRKPLESMLQLTEDAGKVLWQLETTLSSYQSLMEKLLVDISLVEKEKAKITELIGAYLKEVHTDLNKIDHNSTITIRERPIKMLRIELPDWADQESFYELRLKDYIEGITAKGISILEENGNLQEYLGTKVTTKGLYDSVVGIGNVQIKLYKIEAQREYPITWTDVAKNSGGEGFLSAFVILAALLYYMRRDETDIFADRNEGKVLLMDNPFAQTNAAHLLGPLMDMAKKTNTQLICLSGLGGEAIYGCFDNIYVLTLIAASLRNDMQYLKAEHTRGSGEEELLPAQIEVMEQQELVF